MPRYVRALVVSALCSLVCALALANPVLAASGSGLIWRDAGEEWIEQQGKRPDLPVHFRALIMDPLALAQLLAVTPMEWTTAARLAPAVMALPMPDGTFVRFRMEESPVMEPGLASRFPAIKTYRGQGIDDPSATVRFDQTPAGLHAMILTPADTVFIDPYQRGDTTHYISYYKRDFVKAGTYRESDFDPTTLLAGTKLPQAHNTVQPLSPSGSTLHTYRLAVAATGEYSAFYGGTVTGTLAGIVTSINRVNTIYERDLAIHLNLVANTTAIIYLDAATDPYSNNDGASMLSQNQNTLDSIIGSANYDIGHAFSTGGGGVAVLYGTCNSSWKAHGVTGSSQPAGDPFDVDYVSHELGHQFGAQHTFNGTSGACSGYNRSGVSAYEPGSASTIMGYAGICGSDDLQPHSDPYFHSRNIDEISSFIAGNTCDVEIATGNQPPAVEAGTSYTIPAGTPFALAGSASDPDGDTLTYAWEQFDLGAAAPPNTDDGTRPIFRSFNPTPSPVRTFPRLSDILNGASSFGETLPATTRQMHFRLTVRDNHAGAGGVSSDSTTVNVVGTAGPFAILTPDASATWSAGASQTVTWYVANTNAAPVLCDQVDILLSTNGGQTFPITLTAATPNDGSETISVPDTSTDHARVKVLCSTSIFFNISRGDIRIAILSGSGTLRGIVSDSAGNPIAAAAVLATAAGRETREASTTSTTDGAYTLTLPAGTYTVTASAHGYSPATPGPNLPVDEDQTTTLNITLTRMPLAMVSGVISDAVRGTPLFASIVVSGEPDTTWSDPDTGFFSLTLAQNDTYTFIVQPWSPGYSASEHAVQVDGASLREDFEFAVDAATCAAPGYAATHLLRENFDTVATPGLPDGWAAVQVVSTGSIGDWSTTTLSPSDVAPHSAPNLVLFNSFDANAGNTVRLQRIDGFSLPGQTDWQLTFWMYHENNYARDHDSVQVQVCINGVCNAPGDWVNVGAPIKRTTQPWGQWVQHSVSLSEFAGQAHVRIGLLGISAYGNDIHIDDLAVSACQPEVGGYVVGHTYDARTGAPLSGVMITTPFTNTTSKSSKIGTAAGNSVSAGAFYQLFLSPGTQTITATYAGNMRAVTSTLVVQDGVVEQDLYLAPVSWPIYIPILHH
jgi:hypothetical protein